MLKKADDAFHRVYARVRAASLDCPVLVALGDDLHLLQEGSQTSARYVPEAFHLLKAIAHVPITLYLQLSNSPQDLSLDAFANMVSSLDARVDTLDHAAHRPVHDVLERTQALLAQARDAHVDASTLQAFAEQTGHAVLRLTDHATALQLDALDRATAHFLHAISPHARARVIAVVAGAHQARERNLATLYFQKLFHDEPDALDRVVYAEGASTLEDAKIVVLTRQLDRKLAAAFFGDPKRLQRDVLGDAATLRLRSFEATASRALIGK